MRMLTLLLYLRGFGCTACAAASRATARTGAAEGSDRDFVADGRDVVHVGACGTVPIPVRKPLRVPP